MRRLLAYLQWVWWSLFPRPIEPELPPRPGDDDQFSEDAAEEGRTP